MTTSYNRTRLQQIRTALTAAIQEIKQSGNIRQDVVCRQRQILESAELEFIVSNHGSKIVDDMPTRYLFADPKKLTPDDRTAIIDLARFLLKRAEWKMVSGLVNVPAEQVLMELRAAGIVPPLAFEVFLGYFQSEASDSGTQALTA